MQLFSVTSTDIARHAMAQEVSIHKQLDHPNIVGLYDVIETTYHFVLAMEYLDGGDLFDLVPPNEGCPERQV